MGITSGFKSQQGLLLVLSGPSGAGKNSLVDRLRELHPELRYSLSVTTRAPREGERDGLDYYFVTVERFKEMVKRGELCEWAEVYSNYYGTPRSFIEASLAEGADVLLDLDIQGAAQLKKIFPNAVFVFLVPPTAEELLQRIDRRGTDSKEAIALRTQSVKKELEAICDYDYLIVNDSLDNAAARLWSIIVAEKSKVKRIKLEDFVEEFFDSSS